MEITKFLTLNTAPKPNTRHCAVCGKPDSSYELFNYFAHNSYCFGELENALYHLFGYLPNEDELNNN
jgi:hypothetical protein